jgi:hypothetical protein
MILFTTNYYKIGGASGTDFQPTHQQHMIMAFLPDQTLYQSIPALFNAVNHVIYGAMKEYATTGVNAVDDKTFYTIFGAQPNVDALGKPRDYFYVTPHIDPDDASILSLQYHWETVSNGSAPLKNRIWMGLDSWDSVHITTPEPDDAGEKDYWNITTPDVASGYFPAWNQKGAFGSGKVQPGTYSEYSPNNYQSSHFFGLDMNAFNRYCASPTILNADKLTTVGVLSVDNRS